MANEKEVLYKVKIDTKTSEKDSLALTKSVSELTKALKENTKATVDDSREATRQGEAAKKNKQVIDAEKGSIASIREEIKKLTAERNATTLSTEEGRKKVAELNLKLDEHNKTIKTNVDAYTKQKLSIGDYSGGIKEAMSTMTQGVPAMGAFKNAQLGINAVMNANPITGIITLLFAFKQILGENSEFGDKFSFVFAGVNKIFQTLVDFIAEGVKSLGFLKNIFTDFGGTMKQLGQIMLDNVINRFMALGGFVEALILVFRGEFEQAAKRAVDSAVMLATGVDNLGNRLYEAAQSGYEAAEMLDGFTKKQAELNGEIKKNEVAIKSLTFSLKDKTKTEQERIQIATQIADKEIENLKKIEERNQLALQAEQERLKGKTLSGEEEAKLIEMQTEVELAALEQKTIAAQKATRINVLLEKENQSAIKDTTQAKKEQEKAYDDFMKEVEREIDKQKKFIEDEKTAQTELDIWKQEQRVAQAETVDEWQQEAIALEEERLMSRLEGIEQGSIQEQLLIEQSQANINAIVTKAHTKRLEMDKKEADSKKILNASQLTGANALFGSLQGLFKKESGAQKTLALGQLAMNLGVGIASAVKAGAGLIFPANLAAIAAGVGVVTSTIASAKQLLGFADGGRIVSGKRVAAGDGLPITRSNGDNLLATIKTNEVVLNESQQAALGGDETFRRLGIQGFANGGRYDKSNYVQGVDNSSDVIEALKKQKVVLIYEQFEAKKNEKESIEQIATVI